MKLTTCAIVLSLSLGLFAQQANAASIKDILEEAFDSPNGNVTAPLDGQMTDLIRRTTPISGDVMAEVKTIKHFNEAGCRRFSVKLIAMFGRDSGQTGPIPLPAMEMNYCKGGGFPKEGYDKEAGDRFMDQVDEFAKERGIKVPARQQSNYAPNWAASTEAMAIEGAKAAKAAEAKNKQIQSMGGAANTAKAMASQPAPSGTSNSSAKPTSLNNPKVAPAKPNNTR